jgi:hypothetical protein
VYFAPAIPPGGIAYFGLEEHIGWGKISAQLNPDVPFQCYSGRVVTGQPPLAPVTTADTLASVTARLRGSHVLCAPTNVDGENPGAASDPNHLQSYALVPQRPNPLRHVLPFRRQVVANQFGLLLVDVARLARLLVPPATGLTQTPPAPAGPADHFTCYAVRRSRGARAFVPVPHVGLTDQFGSTTVTVGKPTHLCLPANQSSTFPVAPTHGDSMLCYRVPRGMTPVGPVFTNNQFGAGTLQLRSRNHLCVPSVVFPFDFDSPGNGDS